MVDFGGRNIWTSCHCFKLYACIIFLLYVHLWGPETTEYEDKNKSKDDMNTEIRRNFVGNSDSIQEALKQGNLSWEYLRKQNHQINEGEAQPLRIIITSVKDSGDDVLFNVFKRIPGAYIHEFPFMKMQYRPMSRPDTPEAAYAAEALLDLSTCNHKKILESRGNFVRKYWFGVNAKFYPKCQENIRKKDSLCSNIDYLDSVCSASPIQILRVSGDIFHGLNFGRLLYDPWFSKNLKILFVLRDPRGITFQRTLDSKCNQGCEDPSKICSRQRSSLRAAVQFQEFSPENFKVLRYEDLLSNPVSEMKNIIDFLNLKSLKNDTIGFAENPRNQTWTRKLSLDQILNIQNAHNCLHVMRVLGYRPITEPEQLGKMNPITPSLPQHVYEY